MHALEEIRKNVFEQTLAHAYIIEAEAGSSRDQLLKRIAQAILCEEPSPRLRPCGICSACRRVYGGSHEDVVLMERSGKREYRVKEDAIPFMQRLALTPYGRYNVGLILEGEALSDVVQNKILKTLEEPPEGTVILIAISNRKMLLPTVQSRCVLLRESGEETPADDSEMLEMWNQKYFFQYRKQLDGNIKTPDDALHFLDAIERLAYRNRDVELVLRTEETRKDILLDMGTKQALKRLYIEAKDPSR